MARLTVFQCGDDGFLRCGPHSCTIGSLDAHLILCVLLQVVQSDGLGVTCCVQIDGVVLGASSCAIFPIAHLIASDQTILKVLVGGLKKDMKMFLWKLGSFSTEFWCIHYK